jgi:hypothetical protein
MQEKVRLPGEKAARQHNLAFFGNALINPGLIV